MAHEKVWDEVEYYSDGRKIAGFLYRPKDWRPGDAARPAIVCLHGYSGMKDVYGMDVPQWLWEAGYFVLSWDYPGFGVSEGERGRHRPLEQAQATYDSVTFLETVEGVDPERIAYYGSSWGGANAIWCGAFDERVKVIVSAVMVSDGERWMRTVRRPHEWQSFKAQVEEAERKRVVTGEKTTLPLGDIMLLDPHTKDVIDNFHSQDHRFNPEYDLESAAACWRFKPEWVAHKISPRPVLMVYSEFDMLVPVAEQLECYEALGEPKKLLKIPGAQHYDSYYMTNPALHEIQKVEALAWYAKYL
ncbi:MAG: alpha/beta fold hydrolase [Alphaproteobacteria bacterium]|nr:alpha/beta fold hydrolase [Alphaproteobacteria bacterium]